MYKVQSRVSMDILGYGTSVKSILGTSGGTSGPSTSGEGGEGIDPDAPLILNNTLDVGGSLDVGGTARFRKNVTMDKDLLVKGDVDICGNVRIFGNNIFDDVSLSSLTVSQTGLFLNTVDICGATHVYDTLRVDGDISATHIDTLTATVADTLDVEGPLNVFGLTTFDKNVHIRGNLLVDGSTVELHMERLDICDNIILLNKGVESQEIFGHFSSGFEIERGLSGEDPLPRFNMLYNFTHDTEERDDGIFVIGLSGEEQPVATRKYNVANQTLAVWDASAYQYTYDETFFYDIDTETQHVNRLDVSNHATFHDMDVCGTMVVHGPLDICGQVTIHVPDSQQTPYTLNDYMRLLFEQPPAFESVSIQSTQTKIDLSWNKGGLYDQPRYISFANKALPDIQDIVVKITDTSTPAFIYRTYLSTDTEVSFDIDTRYYTDITGTGIASYIDLVSDVSYEFEVYARNSNDGDTSYYTRIVGPVQFQSTGTPSAPRDVSFVSITADTITLTLTRPEFSDFAEETNEADIQAYRVEYEPLPMDASSQRLTYTGVSTSEIVYDVFSGNANDISITIVDDNDQDTVDGRYILPLTVYQINSVSAKNTVNPAYGTQVTNIAPTRKSGFDYTKFKSVNPLANGFTNTSPQKSVYIPGEGVVNNINYFTYGSGPTQLSTNASTSSLYVNRTTDFAFLGKGAESVTDLVNVYIQWRKGTTGTYTNDCEIYFNGYNTDTTIIAPTTTNATGTYFQITDSSVEDAAESDTRYEYFGILGKFKVAMQAGKLSATNLSASPTPYQVKYLVNGATPAILVNGSTPSMNKEYTFYVDDLAGNPSVHNVDASISQIQSVRWNHGIPSIAEFDVGITFDLSNIGSQFLPSTQIVGQLRTRSAASISFQQGTDITTTSTENITDISRSLASLHFTGNIGTTSTPIIQLTDGIEINAIHLNESTGYTSYDISASGKKLHCDYVSFTKSGGSIDTPNHGLSICTWDGTQTNEPVDYADTTQVENNQLVYYNGLFRANGEAYKDWTASTGDYVWVSGVTGFDYSGKTTIPPEGKWVVVKFTNVNIASDTDKYEITYSGSGIKIYTKQIVSTGVNTPWMDTTVDFNDTTGNPFASKNADTAGLGNYNTDGLIYSPGNSTIYVRIMSTDTVSPDISINKLP